MKTAKERVEAHVRSIPAVAQETQVLSEGCRVRFIPGEDRFGTIASATEQGRWIAYQDGFLTPIRQIDYDIEIIGHPLQLHHYLIALDKVQEEPVVSYSVSFEGQLMHYDAETGSMHLTGIWLPLSSPQDWPEEVYQKLAEVLGV